MSIWALLFALLPVVLIFGLLILRNLPADVAGLIGWGAAVLVAWLFFDTSPQVLLRASASGLVASLPIALAMAAAIFQIFVMAETGAMARVVDLIKRTAPTDTCVQMLLINCGIGILFTSFGAVTLSIFPPILLALGYSTFAAIALPCIGYTGGCIYAIMGVPVVIFSSMTGLSLIESGVMFAQLLPFLLSIVSFACLWLTGGMAMLIRGFLPAVAASIVSGLVAIPLAKVGGVTLTGIVVGVLYSAVLLGVLLVRRQPVLARIDRIADQGFRVSLWAALSPWLLLIAVSVVTNSAYGLDLLFHKWSMPVSIIPGRPDKIRLFWQSYFWIPVVTLICFPLLRGRWSHLKAACEKTVQRAPRPVAAMAIFFAIAWVYIYSGYSTEWSLGNPEQNMIGVLSSSAADLLGSLYLAAVPYLGLFAGVISGSQSASVAMLTKLHMTVASHLGMSGIVFALLSAVGGGLSGAISPAKVMTAAAVIGKLGEEGAVLRSMAGIVLVLTTFVAIVAFFLY